MVPSAVGFVSLVSLLGLLSTICNIELRLESEFPCFKNPFSSFLSPSMDEEKKLHLKLEVVLRQLTQSATAGTGHPSVLPCLILV